MNRLCLIRIVFFVLISVFSLCPAVHADLRSPQNIIMQSETDYPTCAYAADLDGDGDLDVLSASYCDDKIAWYENDGFGQFGPQQVITTSAIRARCVYAADLDGDGDLDILSGSSGIPWYENDGSGRFGTQQVINTETDHPIVSVYAVDLDGDGDLDVLSSSSNQNNPDGKIAWYENDGSGQFGPQQVITTTIWANSIYVADMDDDGDLDVLSSSSYRSSMDGKITWYENDGSGQFGQEQVITASSVDSFNSVYATDLDGDGDLDLLSASSGSWEVNYVGKIAWYENNGSGEFGPQQEIGTMEDSVNYVYAADLDGDGDMDALSGEDRDDIAWYENDGYGHFGSRQNITNMADADAVASVYAVDIDGDGDLDILSASSRDDKIAWYDNNGAGRFGSQQVITKNSVSGANSVFTADLDGDGDLDVLSSSYYDHKLAWYENDGAGWFGSQQIISTTSWHPQSVHAADLDGDGDVDVLATSTGYDQTAWYENDGSGKFGQPQVITNNYTSSVSAADLDGDGDMDVLSASSADGMIAWYRNDGSGQFGSQQVIVTEEGDVSSVYAYAADMDGDGDIDVLSASSLNWGQSNKIAWYENDGSGRFGSLSEHVITTPVDNVQSVYATDLDGDGDLDVLSASKGSSEVDYVGNIAWYENDGSGQFGPQQVIYTAAWHSQSVYAADPDGDGDMDVLSASNYYSRGKIALYKNDGSGKFGSQQIISTKVDGANSVYAADLDGDGNLDILSTSSDHGSNDKIAWYKYVSSQFGSQQLITTEADWVKSVYAADLDGDGDLDVLSGSEGDDNIAWYENDGSGQFGQQQVITTSVDRFNTVYAADMDSDGDMDVLSASLGPMEMNYIGRIAWYENEGFGQFGSRQVITTVANGAASVYAADLDGDGDLDVLSASSFDDKIAWYENVGSGQFGSQQVITTEADWANSVYATDLDGDGDFDVLSTSQNDGKIAWYENDGAGNFGSQQVITTETDWANSVYAADLDGDGDQDVLSASSFDDKIAWYENDGSGQFGSQQVITTETDWANSVYATDLDGDGDFDVLSASQNDDKIAWYENDGAGNFGSQQVITTEADWANSVYAADLDGDGDLDVLSAGGNKIAWYKNE
jgi:hypothetical protein